MESHFVCRFLLLIVLPTVAQSPPESNPTLPESAESERVLPVHADLSLAAAEVVAAAAEAEARRNGWTVSTAVVDRSGRLLRFHRMDGTPSASVDVAIGKAVHSASYRRPTAFHQGLLEAGNAVVLGLPGVLPVEGGLPIEADGRLVGAVGVSGMQAPEDGQCAAAAAAALAAWLVPDRACVEP